MYLVAAVYAALLKHVQDWTPSLSDLLEPRIDQACWSLWPRIHHRPEECTRKRDMCRQAEVLASFCRKLDLVDRPIGTSFRVLMQLLGREAIK